MSDLKTLETIYAEVVRRFQVERENTKHLDDKASNIMVFVGIIAGILSGIGAYTLKTTNLLAATFFFAALMILIESFVFGLAAYQVMKFTLIPNAYYLVGFYENKRKERILRDLNYNFAVAIEKNMKLNEKKAMRIKSAIDFLFAAIILLLLFVVSAYG
jgi:hypothetical protein